MTADVIARVIIDGRRAAAVVAATLALALSVAGWPPADVAAQGTPVKKRSASASDTPKISGHGIVVVVNDDAITAYEIDQRARLLGLGVNVSEQAKANFQSLVKSDALQEKIKDLQREIVTSNPGKSQAELVEIFKERQKQIAQSLQKQAIESARAAVLPKLKKNALEELIDDRLKVQAAKKKGVEVTDDDAKELVKGIAERNKMTYDAFAQNLKSMGVDVSTMTEKFKAQKVWRELTTRMFGAQITVSQRDVDQFLASVATEHGQDAVELQIQKLSLTVPGKADQVALTKRIAEAEELRRRSAGCKGMVDQAKTRPDVRVHDLKYVKPSSISEPTRSLLLSAKDNDVLPPVTTASGVDLYAVCGRKTLAGDESLQAKAKNELQYKQLDIFAQRYLRNLRQEANIEYR